MTVLTKPINTVKKIPLVDECICDEVVVEMQPTDPRNEKRPEQNPGSAFCMVITMFLLLLMAVVSFLQMYRQMPNSARAHYQGFCSIPMPQDMQMFEPRKMPLRWKSAPKVEQNEPNFQVLNFIDDDSTHIFDLLREVLDIDIDDSVEKISVLNNGHPVSFIHDFESNVTGIVDSKRCFTMELDPELVLQPELFLLGLQRGDEFDVSRVRTQLRAALPPLAPDALAPALQPCAGKPTYRLQKDTDVVIRKRSADAPPHDYMQFAGRRVQEIQITNLADLLQHEQDSATR